MDVILFTSSSLSLDFALRRHCAKCNDNVVFGDIFGPLGVIFKEKFGLKKQQSLQVTKALMSSSKTH